MRPERALRWWRLHWPNPLEPDPVLELLRAWAADTRSPVLALEVRAKAGEVSYWLGAGGEAVGQVRVLRRLIPDSAAVLEDLPRPTVVTVRRLRMSTRHRQLGTNIEAVARAIHAALTLTDTSEVLIMQLLLGPRRVPLAVPNRLPGTALTPWWQLPFTIGARDLDPEPRTALRTKVGEHGFAATLRIGVSAATPSRRQALSLGLFAALRTSETPGLKLRLRPDSVRRFNAGMPGWWWPLRLNVSEAANFCGWPIGKDPIPGAPNPHPRLVRPVAAVTGKTRVIGQATAPGENRSLVLRPRDALSHLHVIGPTGVGKSTLLQSLILADITAGFGVVVIDPKGDLVADVCARIPAARRRDVVVLDPADELAPVGLNPFAIPGASPDLVADGILAVFHGLYRDAWGPRVQDVLHAGLLTLARTPEASLLMLPLLLTNPGVRRRLVDPIAAADPVGLGPFWEWFESLSPGEAAQVLAPVMSRLRALLLRHSMRHTLGQTRPRFHIGQVLTERKVLLVDLAKGRLGPEGSALLGSLLVSQLWQATTARASLPAAKRAPVFVYIDEVQDYLHLPTDLADVLAQSRGLGVGLTLAHQTLSQLTPAISDAILANARSRVCFKLAEKDAAIIARGTTQLTADDFTTLPAFAAYASLMANAHSTGYASIRTLPPTPAIGDPDRIRQASRTAYGQPVAAIETEISQLLATSGVKPTGPVGRRPRNPA